MAKILYESGNHLQLLHTGEDFFPAMLDSIKEAQQEIYLETYIFSGDDSAREIAKALMQAAARGVQVHVIIDWVGTGEEQCQRWVHEFQQHGVGCRVFNAWFKRGLTRTHRKLCVIDRELAFIGGINVIDDFLSDHDSSLELPFPRWDFAVKLLGPCAISLHKEITAQWLKLGKMPLINRLLLARELRRPPKAQQGQGQSAAIVFRDNLRHRFSIQRAYLRALGKAKQSAYFANPYFAPGRRLRNGLINAAKRGVDVRILLGVGEFELQDLVAQSYYPQLLKHGIKIYEYHRTHMHAKVAVIDGAWSTVGSSNFDGLSLFLNHEANILIQDVSFSAELQEHMCQGFADAVEVEVQHVERQPWYTRFKHRLAYSFYRWALRLATLGQYR